MTEEEYEQSVIDDTKNYPAYKVCTTLALARVSSPSPALVPWAVHMWRLAALPLGSQLEFAPRSSFATFRPWRRR